VWLPLRMRFCLRNMFILIIIDYKVKVQGRKLLGDFRNNRF
jgi:hypothetical protein